jgi:hypothetical protein
MSAAEKIFADALALSVQERRDLAGRLWDSLEDVADRQALAARSDELNVSLDAVMTALGIARTDVPR